MNTLLRTGAALLLLIVAASLVAPYASAQMYPAEMDKTRFELTPFVGYQWNTRTNSYGGEFSTKDGLNYGGILDIHIQRNVDIELLYIYHPTQTRLESYTYGVPSTDYFDVSFHYMQIGYVKSLKPHAKVEPFVAASLGAWVASTPDITYQNVVLSSEDIWRFAIAFGGGAKIWFSERLGLRLQARVMFPIYFYGGSMYFGTGGSGFAVSGGIPMMQGDFTAGLIIAF